MYENRPIHRKCALWSEKYGVLNCYNLFWQMASNIEHRANLSESQVHSMDVIGRGSMQELWAFVFVSSNILFIINV